MNSIDLYNKIRKKYNSLSEFDKLEIYMDYYIKEISFSNKVHVLNIEPKLPLLQDFVFTSCDNEVPGFKGNRELGIIWGSFVYNKPDTFDQFCHPESMYLFNASEEWKERGYAARYLLKTNGIYKYLKEEIISNYE